MPVPVLTFFNNKGGVGKTSLVYHLAWMYAEQGLRVVAVDLDPQANLTAAFLDEDRLAQLWDDAAGAGTIFRSVKPLLSIGDYAPVEFQEVDRNLALVPGDLGLSSFEDELSSMWTAALSENKDRPMRILTAFWRSAQDAAARFAADLIVFDVGPNLGAINRAALLASSHVVVPLGADLFSLQGLRNLGPALRKWRADWTERRRRWECPAFDLPSGTMEPVGYVAMRHGVRLARPVQAYTRWLDRIPAEFRRSVLDEPAGESPPIGEDPLCLALLKNYNSLMPLAQEARKPIFSLLAAEGAIGSHANAAAGARDDFRKLAQSIAQRIGVHMPCAASSQLELFDAPSGTGTGTGAARA
ncbi:ParA family protein [Verminephrobacter aporrectodeae subsp. tuberculatae]|uniref:ParA family protein n=1 Tax=Verminephrobacter aporrectodeae TaxID=1110389 RepID=UPI00223788C0|nr:ParA family protein [Verminephrobacter aporrectodeae]MCW5221734.1 ParA family protein [Verminephrobacter aporrectodeae subsp. tuberculatae]MCW5258048.1 ParA family protein [Verminephrobacter aporrectodeae subsp. tuberculatae]MCW5291024.1 ParA family protein [Verminephrobacter aporrectodeae subsp. tuberculatae]MCW8199761.1 ParA family protein [Verminephrobacter aporrectodeae subsp. tuberculatae]